MWRGADRQRSLDRIDSVQRERLECRRQTPLHDLRAQPTGGPAVHVGARAMDALIAELLNKLRDAVLESRPLWVLRGGAHAGGERHRGH
jgi:hypothetical protein